MRRIRLGFAGRSVEFVDRDVALRQIAELGERGTRFPLVVYGPEGCGKTALLLQARAMLEDAGYEAIYVNPVAGELGDVLGYSPSLRDVVREVLSALPDPLPRIVDAAISVASLAMRRLSRPRLALLLDDVFQAIGVDRAELYVKALLNLIEYPPSDYDRIVVIVASSEGVTRRRVGRHRWAEIRMIWNMPRQGFEELYNLLPNPKPRAEDAWKLTGGNPGYLEALWRAGWAVDAVVDVLVRRVAPIAKRWRAELEAAAEDPDYLWDEYPRTEALIDELVEANLIAEVWDRKQHLWVDQPPPEKDPELGIGRFYAWQTPLHREAAQRALRGYY